MISRTVEISREPAHLSLRDGQLLITRKDDDRSLAGSIPCEDLGVLIIDEPQTTMTAPALAALVEQGACVVLCGRDHLPVGVMLPVSRHTEVATRAREQAGASLPTSKRLWKQIVVAKIEAQAANLGHDERARKQLLAMRRSVRSGDPTNREAQAARVYWASWLGDDPLAPSFRRRPGEPKAPAPNALLDYGYAALRAAMARRIVAVGLTPALGLHHHHRANAFCLADDLIEPLRPMVDRTARRLAREGRTALTQDVKAELLLTLTGTVTVDDATGPLDVAMHRCAASLAQCFSGERQDLAIPSFPCGDAR